MRLEAYELHRLQGGRWTIDSIYNDRESALLEGRRLLGSRFALSVRVVQERYDQASGERSSRVIFNSHKVEQPREAPAVPEKMREPDPPPSAPPRKKKRFITSLILLVIGTGGAVLAGVLALVAVLHYTG